MIVAHNLMSQNTSRTTGINNKGLAKVTEKLSSGYKINRAADNAAGLSISEKMRWQIRGLDRASDNVQDGISLLQVADGALTESHALLQRMNELCVQAANDTNTNTDRQAIQAEVDQLSKELTRIAQSTSFNGHIYPLCNGMTLPDNIQTRTASITNNGTYPIECNGSILNPGDTTTIDVAGVVTGPGPNDFFTALSCRGSSSAGNYWYCTNHMYPDASSPNELYYIEYRTLDDIQIDENGYLYVDDLGDTNQRCYISESMFQNPFGFTFSSFPPPVAELEQYNVIKAVGNTEPIRIQCGSLSGQSIDIPYVNATAGALGVDPLDVSSFDNAGLSMSKVQNAIDTVSGFRSTFGALQNRMEHTLNNLRNTSENTQSAESLLRDTDMAEAMVEYSKFSILSQTSQSMLSQAQQIPQNVLSLLQ